ncbi:TlpA family protein disulfide reductase [Hymenobacter caeli]|uniref:Peroxiredoxin n=1 Tax=Hymenobacter caeli TaxID=2735894 RepID=A0ABX2FS93_9BACT|nr:redoxin domain-containing protein [Hymenobacter caeli]NRT19329.1 peroxiredoxin [Hymenobacter caeli]
MSNFFTATFYRLLAAPLLLAPLLGQAQDAASAAASGPGTAVITGRVSSPQTDSIAVSLRDNPLDAKERIVRAALSSKGEFRISVPVAGATKADLVYGDDVASLYLDAGTDLDVRFKGEDMSNSLKFKANDVPAGLSTKLRNAGNLTDAQRHRVQAANANAYLAEADEQFVENDGFQVLPDNVQLYEAPFLSFLEYRRKHENEFLEDRAGRQAFTAEFYKYAKAEVAYAYANDRLTFQDLREQVVSTEGRLKMSATYYDFLNDPALLNNPDATQSELYHEFLVNYLHHAAAAANHQRTDPDFYTYSFALAGKQLTGPIKAIIQGRVMEESFRFGHVKYSAAMLAEFHAADPQSKFYPVLQADFDQHKDFAIGAPAPNFRLPSAKGDTVSLRDFAGKLVYLNFWKSTNGLCLRDLVYAQDLIHRFENKNIVFINIALDENEQAWRQLVKAKSLPGVQVRVPVGGLKSGVAKAYAVQEVPAYFLIGEDGTFLNTKPKRLSSRAAIDEINQAFGKAGAYTSAIETAK